MAGAGEGEGEGVSKAKLSMKLKLIIDTEANKVVFAEADKDFVDFLFDILSLSVGTVAQLLKDKDMAGCLGRLYGSVEALNQEYLLPNVTKDLVLKQRSLVNVPMLYLKQDAPQTNKPLYTCFDINHPYVTDDIEVKCPSCQCPMSKPWHYEYVAPSTIVRKLSVCPNYHRYITDGLGATCPQCGHPMTYSFLKDRTFLPSGVSAESNARGGYVKSMIKYAVMDDLVVKPMSISLITSPLVKDTRSLIKKDVEVGFSEGLAMLEASLKTQDVLTAVFLPIKMET